MKLTTDEIQLIRNVVQSCNIIGVESVVIDKDSIRGINEDRTALILDKTERTTQFDAIGLSRIKSLTARIMNAGTNNDLVIDALCDENTVKDLTLKGKNVTVQYKCAGNHSTIKAPKDVKDAPYVILTLAEEVIPELASAVSVMRGDNLLVSYSNEKLQFIVHDDTGDAYTVDLPSATVELLDPEADSDFIFKYPADLVLSVLKQAADKTFSVVLCKKGTMISVVNDLNIYVLPRVQ